jgi:hypothetical protein
VRPQTITISVTNSDIKKGKPGMPDDCPVYHAVRNRFSSKVKDVGVVHEHVGIVHAGGSYTINFPKKVGSFITKFDQHKRVKPFKFKLKVPGDLVTFLKKVKK